MLHLHMLVQPHSNDILSLLSNGHYTHKTCLQLIESGCVLMQLRLNYPSSLLSIASESSCQTGADWPASSLTFVCNARGNANSVFFNSILQPPFASQRGSAVRVATIQFTAVAAGTGALSVDILGLAQYGGRNSSGTTAVAAATVVSCSLPYCI